MPKAMRMFSTEAIVLRRTNYGEADRILALMTPDRGKLSAMAKGVRRPKSKLAGGLELFATSDLTLAQGRGDIYTLTSARLSRFYGNILHDYDRMQTGYECIKQINQAAETVTEAAFYYLLRDMFTYLDELSIDYRVAELWFRLQLATLLGRGLNTATDTNGQRLAPDKAYNFDFNDMAFVPHADGRFTAQHIKLLRLAYAKNPAVLRQVSGLDEVLDDCLWLVRTIEQ